MCQPLVDVVIRLPRNPSAGDSFVEKIKWRIFIKKHSLPNGMRIIMMNKDGIKRKLNNLETMGRAGYRLEGV